ncbi:NAD binding domain of 6-phosphogluconate dehydrogenase-domain-containing protein [Bisporella sp. PMI_857]|nr:NAD binding domain of 6-phosphogluconate dehydrogenase-domain-containing protein [Bisporella sp. PMI_857]
MHPCEHPKVNMPRIGFYGLGSMGIRMALNLQNHLSSTGLGQLHFSNRTLSKGDPLKAAGAVAETDFASLVKSSDIIFTMISNDAVLGELVETALSSGDIAGKIFVDTSTVHPDSSERASEALAKAGAQFIASPVFGASPMAAAGKLIFAMAGQPAALEKVKPLVLNVMGRSIIELGEDVKKSSLLKITGNVMVIGLMELISEVQVFAEKSGLGTVLMEKFIGDMFGPVADSYSKRLTSGSYAPPLTTPPGFAVSLAIKDAKHALSIANDMDMRLPVSEIALSNMLNARNFAGENLDSSSMYGTIRVQSGLSFWSAQSRQGN